ncbi:MAG: ATP-binding protein [bacterium]|nr:ATP-binding protein [bacterium]
MNYDIYHEYNPWWTEKYTLENIVERASVLNKMEKFFDSRHMVFLTGLRRVGKTTLMKIFIQRLINRGIEPQKIFYVSLDDYVLDDKSIIDIVDDYRKLHKLPVEEKVYFFFDEVAHKEKFHQQLKNLYDRQNVKIYASASSSSILKDSKAYLTGRGFLIEVQPLDFYEFLEFRKVAIKSKDRKLLEPYFLEFLKTGGIPEYVLHKEREYLRNLVDDIIYKDIIAHHKIKNPQVIKDLFKILMGNIGGPVSVYKISNTLKVSSDTISRYLEMFEATYLIYLVYRHGGTNQKFSSPRKIYAGDIGIRNLFTGFIKKGRAFENYVYLKFKEFQPVYVYENQIEIDFYLDNDVLVEVKFEEDIRENQKTLFDGFKAAHKFVVKGYEDVENLQDFLK